MTDLGGKVALVTGGGSGIGEACAKALATAGALVLVSDIAVAAAERVAGEIGASAAACAANVADEAQCDAMVAFALERFGRLDSSRTKPGFGLGLSLAKAVAGIHNGTLELKDNAPGLAVVLTLPADSAGQGDSM